MKTLLVINSSGRVTRSLTRRLTEHFCKFWLTYQPEGRLVRREVGIEPPPPVNESWIAQAFADRPPEARASAALSLSDELIAELSAADTVLLGSPIYNFGMPAQLKAYFDQVVRVGRTFAFDPESSDPYRPLLPPRPVIVVTSAGDGALNPGGELHHLNYLEPHLRTLLAFMGLTDVTFVRVGYDEFQDGRFRRSLAAAERALDKLAQASDRTVLASATSD